MQVPKDHFNLPIQLNLKPSEPLQNNKQNHSEWSPYETNGGNIIAYAQDDFVIFGADTRCSRGYSILHRKITKIHQLTEDTFILTAGMYADTLNLWKKLDEEIELYQLTHGKKLSSKSIANMLSRTLYAKRFFPFYTFNIIVGMEDGKAQTWGFDAVGSFGKGTFHAAGEALEMLSAHTGVIFGQYNNIKKVESRKPEEVIDMIVDVFNGVAERDITCGDNLEIFVLQKGHVVAKKVVPLRSD